MADNSPAETSGFSIQDGMASLLQDPQIEENQTEEEAAEPDADEAMAQPLDEDYEADETEADEADDEADYDEDEEDAFDDEADESDDEQPEMFTVKIDGIQEQVTLEQALAGYQRQSAFTKRMQALAEERKSFEAEATQTKQMRDAYADGLNQLAEQLQSSQSQEPDWNRLKAELDPMEYADVVRLHQQQKENLQNVQVERQRIAREQQTEQHHRYQAHLQNEAERMLEVIPSWRDDDVRTKERAAVVEYATTIGYTAEEIAQASDHRAVKALYDSWKLSQLNSQANTAKKKVRKAPKMAKAGAPRPKGEANTRRRNQARKRLDNERSINAAVDLLLQK